MEKCFVIQPFDGGKFDKRYADIFQPAISKVGLEPYRIDRDLSVRIPIDEIEKGIIESAMCFAEITTDNPNVWYELGFAFACNKDVVMVCSDERKEHFPFDIQHRQIIRYKTASKSDYETLEDTITKKITALQQNIKTVKKLSASPVADTEGLKSYEIAMLIILMGKNFTKENSLPVSNLIEEMDRAGYTEIATSVGIRTLGMKGMLETINVVADDINGQYEYTSCKLTNLGENWILEHQEQLVFRIEPPKQIEVSDDLPF